MVVKGIHHFTIVVSDIKDSLHFYNELGGLQIKEVEHKDDMDCYHLLVPDDGELLLVDRKGKQTTNKLSARTVRFHHIAIRVDEPRDYYKKFLPVSTEYFILKHADIFGHYVCSPTDSDGVRIEWIHPYEPIPNNYFVEKDFSVCPGFHHFCIYVANCEESMKLYRDVLGFKQVREVLGLEFSDGTPIDAYYLQVPGSGELEFLDHRGLQKKLPIDPLHTGARCFAFAVDNPSEFCDHLQKNGYAAYMEAGVCKMIDPNGVWLEFIG